MNAHPMNWSAVLRTRGHRLTPQRLLILETLERIHGHATVEDIFEQAQPYSETLNRATVYRTLQFLCDIGIATSTTAPGGRLVYELRGADQHHHLICSACGASFLLPHTVVLPMLSEIEVLHGFAVSETLHLSLFGICEHCRSHMDATGVPQHDL